MADKPLSGLPLLTSAELTGDMLVYLSIPVGTDQFDSRATTLGDLKTFVNTDPTVVPSSEPWRGCRVRMTSDDTGLTLTSMYILSWDAEDIDTDGIWSIGAPTRLVVPSGVTKVRLTTYIALEASAVAGSEHCSIRKNGAVFSAPDQMGRVTARHGTTGFSNNNSMAFTPVLEVTAGDYFEANVQISGLSGVDQVLVGSWFEMEIIEASS